MIANVQHWTELIARRLSGNIREDESRMLDDWLSRDPEHLEYFAHLSAVWKVAGSVRVYSPPEADWTSLERHLHPGMGKVVIPRIALPKIRTIRMIGAAAIVLFLIATGVVFLLNQSRPSDQIVVEASASNTQEVLLPDGSKVMLRRGSTLQYDADFDIREVTLSGEAFFDVAHDEDSSFSIVAGHGNIRVIGTKFNIKALPGGPVELFVEEGRVAFAPISRRFEAKIFSEGQAGILADSTDAEVERSAAPGINVTSWINGRLVFDHTTLDHVLRDIFRHYSVSVYADSSLYICELKADFDNATLDNVLETLRFSLNLQITKSGESYIISGEPCASDLNN